jgi:hypothetical protein
MVGRRRHKVAFGKEGCKGRVCSRVQAGESVAADVIVRCALRYNQNVFLCAYINFFVLGERRPEPQTWGACRIGGMVVGCGGFDLP